MVKLAWAEIRASTFVRGGVSAMIIGALGFFGVYWAGYVGKNETFGRCLVAIFAAIIGSVLTCGGEFLFRLLRAPSKMELEINEKHAGELRGRDAEKQAVAAEYQQSLATRDAENRRLASALGGLMEQTKPLEIEVPSTIGGDDILVWKSDLVACVSNQNPTREVGGVVVRVLKIDPSLNGPENGPRITTDDCGLRDIKLKFSDLPGDTLNGGMVGRIPILEAERTPVVTIVKFCGRWESNYPNRFIPEPHREYALTLEVTANGLKRKEARFRLSFPLAVTLPIVASTAISALPADSGVSHPRR